MMTMIGAYEVSGVLGQGGMATVYKGYHRRLNRHVAIKMIHQGQDGDPGFRIRFEREAQIVANLEHPNIVPVYDISDHEGSPYLVMKFIEGCSLKEILSNGALQVQDIIQIVKPIASAIDYAHAQGVLHRDIKPSNMLLDKSGTAYLSDFGLARFAQQGESTLSADMVIGTPYYISPEQALGKVPVDSRADLYSFGVVLYELLVGRVPYNEGTPYSIIHDHIYQQLPLPRTLNPNVPTDTEQVLLRALAKDRDARYPTATELVTELLGTLRSDDTTLLRAEARHAAAESLAKVRPLTTPPPVSNLADDGMRTTVESVKAVSQPKRRRGVSCGVAVVALAAVIVSVVLFSRISGQLRATSQANATLTAAAQPTPQIDVPRMDIRESETYLAEHPGDPLAYIVRARSLFAANQNLQAQQMLREGWQYASDPVAYVLMAAQTAIADGHEGNAFEVLIGAVRIADGTEHEEAIRSAVGAPLYQLSGDPAIYNSRRLTFTFTADDPPLVIVIHARAAYLQDRVLPAARATARAAAERALSQMDGFSEAHLVLGELYADEGRITSARAEWRRARGNEAAPQWVRDRADALIAGA